MDGLEEEIMKADQVLLDFMGVPSDAKIIYTSGATESNVWAIHEAQTLMEPEEWGILSAVEHLL